MNTSLFSIKNTKSFYSNPYFHKTLNFIKLKLFILPELITFEYSKYYLVMNIAIKYYSPKEELINVLSHAFGLLLSIIALPLLIYKAVEIGNALHITSASIYGTSSILLYLASTLFHWAKKEKLVRRLNIFDHSSIYVLIAGTYTPFALITLNGTVGWVVFGLVWGFAIIGIILKLFFTGKYRLVSTIMYVLMGWLCVIFGKSLIQNLPEAGLWWLFAGGLAYTIGAVLYYFRKIPFNHATFHFFVLIGSFCHFVAIYWYVLK